MKTICLFSPGILPIPATQGGAIETLIDILIEQNEIDHRVNLVVFSIEDEREPKQIRNYQYTQVVYIKRLCILEKVYNFIYRGIRKVARAELPFSNLYYWQGYRRLKKLEIDYIVAEGGDYNFFDKVREVVGQENIYLHIHHHLLPSKGIDTIFDNIIGVSHFVAEEWKRNSKNPQLTTRVVYNCVREEVFSKEIDKYEKMELKSELGFDEEDFIVLFCGRIVEVKGIRELLQAMERISHKRIKLLVIGSPEFAKRVKTPYLKEVQAMINNMKDRVKFTGYIVNEELYKYYQIANLQVIPSLWEEAAGLVAIEGMVSGLPLIVTESGGLVEYTHETCAMQIKRDEKLVKNLADNILKLYADQRKMSDMADAARIRAKRFSKKNFYNDFIDAILKID